jgi:hypothetical protein
LNEELPASPITIDRRRGEFVVPGACAAPAHATGRRSCLAPA